MINYDVKRLVNCLLVVALIMPMSFLMSGCSQPRIGIIAIYDIVGNPTEAEIDATLVRLRDLLIGSGFTTSHVERYGPWQIRVGVSGMQDADELLRIIGNRAEIEFRRGSGGESFLTSKDIETTYVFQAQTFDWGVRLFFTEEGSRNFVDAIHAEGVGGSIRIYSNGWLILQPTIISTDFVVGGSADITGGFNTRMSAEQFRAQIEAGLFEVQLQLNEINIVRR